MKVDRHRRKRRVFWWTAGTLLVVSWVASVVLWVVTAPHSTTVAYNFPRVTSKTEEEGIEQITQSGVLILMMQGEVYFIRSEVNARHRDVDLLSEIKGFSPSGFSYSRRRYKRMAEYFPWREHETESWRRLGFQIDESANMPYISPATISGKSWNCPFWAIALLPSFPLIGMGYRVYIARRRVVRMRRNQCVECGYDLRSSVGACPECGARRRGGHRMMNGSTGAGG